MKALPRGPGCLGATGFDFAAWAKGTGACWSVPQPVWSNRVDDLTAPMLSAMNVRYAIVRASLRGRLPPGGWRPSPSVSPPTGGLPCPSARMVSVMARAVSGLTADDLSYVERQAKLPKEDVHAHVTFNGEEFLVTNVGTEDWTNVDLELNRKRLGARP